ncbi:hypothetical protein CKO09_12740 [Chromatium weissei]|nr:hypothetical protein [Chromatium weissei]
MELSTGTDCNCQLPLPTLITPEPTQSTALLVLPMLIASRVVITQAIQNTVELLNDSDCNC